MVELLLALLITLTGIPRTVDADLSAIAQRRAVEIQSDFSHNGWDPSTAEIIAWNRSADPVTTLASQWQGSPPHWAILTDPKYDRWGCGISQVGDAYYGACVFRSGTAPNVSQPTLPPPNVSNPPESSHPPILLPNTALEHP